MRVKRCWLCSPVKAAPAGEPRPPPTTLWWVGADWEAERMPTSQLYPKTVRAFLEKKGEGWVSLWS